MNRRSFAEAVALHWRIGDACCIQRIGNEIMGNLNFNAALAGLDFIANGELTTADPAVLHVLTGRLIERLLDQLDDQRRKASDSEDTFLRRAIAHWGSGGYREAVDCAYRAAETGHLPIFGQLAQPDRTVELRAALDAARG
ncbi:hypothetical protein [Cupriavidus pauculus]|uniref:hypothetical protein n=1 Tax=Cupriavidus pauculus TaxID=82633 RepID=UPI003857844C